MKFITVILLVVFLTLSGIIDFFVIFNDAKGPLSDIGANKTATWIAGNTPKDAVILNSSFLYHPASIAGRKIFLGWPYFSWSAGYDTNTRLKEMRAMYDPDSLPALCKKLKAYAITYVTFQTKHASGEVDFHEDFYRKNFTRVFSGGVEEYRIYSIQSGCK